MLLGRESEQELQQWLKGPWSCHFRSHFRNHNQDLGLGWEQGPGREQGQDHEQGQDQEQGQDREQDLGQAQDHQELGQNHIRERDLDQVQDPGQEQEQEQEQDLGQVQDQDPEQGWSRLHNLHHFHLKACCHTWDQKNHQQIRCRSPWTKNHSPPKRKTKGNPTFPKR